MKGSLDRKFMISYMQMMLNYLDQLHREIY